MEFRNFKSERLASALAVAEEFASRFKREGVIGIVFLGGIARGYFDKFSDIDIIIFKRKNVDLGVKMEGEFEYKGFRIDYEIVDYEDLAELEWSMEMKWAFSMVKIFYDPEEKIKSLIEKKVRLRDEERKWLIIEGVTQSDWYCNTVSESWIYRNDPISAHYSIICALEELVKALFMLNNELLPPSKWRIYLVQSLKWLPEEFNEKLKEVLLVRDFSIEELKRRRESLNYLWRQVLPKAEREVGMKFSEFKKLV
ncbi:MAG: hypothetical protein DRJ37_01910 [Thermoprotei archaeon]|nr:MAG: hypothetical protein DRJ37_01910 [Thermoprotei archaeon]